jgi:ubiquinone/menaquinone biosynthesis C-methylase UbiE
MRLNSFEKLLMNNPVRAWIHRHFEARRLFRLGGKTSGGLTLEIGCGRGVGVEILKDVFDVRQVHAFDLDPGMIELARRQLTPDRNRVDLWVGDVSAIAARDNTYDNVFDFGAIHHVVEWRSAVKEIYRVVKPGGRIYIEEILAKWITHPVFRHLMDHPQTDRFDLDQFTQALRDCGFKVRATDQVMQLFAWFIADKPRLCV